MSADLRIAALERQLAMEPDNDGIRMQLSALLAQSARVEESEAALPGVIKNAKNAREYVLASNGKRPRRARFTVANTVRGERITFCAQRERLTREGEYDPATDDNDGRWWTIGAMVGSDNTTSYAPFGVIKADEDGQHRFYWSSESRVPQNDKTVMVFADLWNKLSAHFAVMPQGIEFHHEGVCARCGRVLTVPESLETGQGPVCGRHIASAQAPVQPRQ